MYDQTAVAEIILFNKGHVGFEFTALGMDPALANNPKPSLPQMVPHAVSSTAMHFANLFY